MAWGKFCVSSGRVEHHELPNWRWLEENSMYEIELLSEGSRAVAR